MGIKSALGVVLALTPAYQAIMDNAAGLDKMP